MGTVSGPTVTVSYYQVEGLDYENRAKFASETDRQVFLDAIKNAREADPSGILNPSLTFPKPINADELGLTNNKLTQAWDIMGDAITAVMTVLHEIGVEQRKAAKEVRKTEQDAQVESIQDQAAKIRDAAAFALAAGLASGISTMASGAMSLVGTSLAGAKLSQTAKIINNPETPGKITAMGSDGTIVREPGQLSTSQQSTVGYLNARADVIRGGWQAGGQLLSGMGEVIKAGFDYASKRAEADAKMIEAETAQHQYAAQSADEVVQAARELVNDVRQKLGELLQARGQIESKIWS